SMNRASGLLLTIAVLLAACTSAKTAETRRLQAQNAYERGLTQAKQGQSSLAVASLQQAVTLAPRSAIYHDSRGLLLLDAAQVAQAIAALNKSLDLDPNRGDSYFHLGTALAEARRWDDAVAAYRKAILLPSLTVLDLAHQNLGLAFFHLKHYREA